MFGDNIRTRKSTNNSSLYQNTQQFERFVKEHTHRSKFKNYYNTRWFQSRHQQSTKQQYLIRPDQLQEDLRLKKIFDTIDIDMNNQVDICEMTSILQKYGFNIKKKDIIELYRLFNKSELEGLTFDEFKSWISSELVNQKFQEIIVRSSHPRNRQVRNCIQAEPLYIPTSFESLFKYLSFLINRDTIKSCLNRSERAADKFTQYQKLIDNSCLNMNQQLLNQDKTTVSLSSTSFHREVSGSSDVSPAQMSKEGQAYGQFRDSDSVKEQLAVPEEQKTSTKLKISSVQKQKLKQIIAGQGVACKPVQQVAQMGTRPGQDQSLAKSTSSKLNRPLLLDIIHSQNYQKSSVKKKLQKLIQTATVNGQQQASELFSGSNQNRCKTLSTLTLNRTSYPNQAKFQVSKLNACEGTPASKYQNRVLQPRFNRNLPSLLQSNSLLYLTPTNTTLNDGLRAMNCTNLSRAQDKSLLNLGASTPSCSFIQNHKKFPFFLKPEHSFKLKTIHRIMAKQMNYFYSPIVSPSCAAGDQQPQNFEDEFQ